jgi:hypothetical protein
MLLTIDVDTSTYSQNLWLRANLYAPLHYTFALHASTVMRAVTVCVCVFVYTTQPGFLSA